MGRHTRSHAPGMIFHLTSRTHRKEPLFVPQLRSSIATLIRDMVGRTDAELLAYAVMPTHLHVLLRQGRSRLDEVMQPLMRRVALRVQRHHGFEGGVVERRYRDTLCAKPDHVRDAVVYVSLNPWRAGLCDDDLAYPWATHDAYLPGADPATFGIHPHAQLRVLKLYASDGGMTRDQLCAQYVAALEWRMQQDRLRKGCPGEPSGANRAWRPAHAEGDRVWLREFQPALRDPAPPPGVGLPDLRDFLLGQLSMAEGASGLPELRGRRLPRRLSRIRRRLIRTAAARGYRTVDLARLFDVSPAAVSQAKYAAKPDPPPV